MSRCSLVLLPMLFLTGCIAPQTFEYYRAESGVASKELQRGWCPPYALNELMVEDGVRATMQALVRDSGIVIVLQVVLAPGRTFRLTLPHITIRFADSLSTHTVILDRFNTVTRGHAGKTGRIQYYGADAILVGIDVDTKHVSVEPLYWSINNFETSGLLPAAKPPNEIFVSVPDIEINGKLRRFQPISMQLIRRTVLVSQCG